MSSQGVEEDPPINGLSLRPVRLATTPDGEEGRLVVTSTGLLIAILVLLDPTSEDADPSGGSWFLEAGFGPCQTACPPIFAGLNDACSWIAARVRTKLS